MRKLISSPNVVLSLKKSYKCLKRIVINIFVFAYDKTINTYLFHSLLFKWLMFKNINNFS